MTNLFKMIRPYQAVHNVVVSFLVIALLFPYPFFVSAQETQVESVPTEQASTTTTDPIQTQDEATTEAIKQIEDLLGIESESIEPPAMMLGEGPPVTHFEDARKTHLLNPQLSVEESTGAFIYTIPIVTPPGRSGIEPDISLIYNSQSDLNEYLGKGWSINIPYIERINRTGTDNFYTNVEDYFYSSFDGELRATTTSAIEGLNLAANGNTNDGIFGTIARKAVSILLGSPNTAHAQELTPISDLLHNKTAEQRANIKGQEIAKIDFTGEYISKEYGVKIEIQSIEAIEGGIELFAKAWKNGKQLGFGKNGSVDIERFIIINPPVLVEDPNGDIVREWTDKDTGELKQRKLREDPAESIRQSLSHTITLVGKENTKIIKGKVGNTTLTVYPNAGTGTAPVDGVALRTLVAGTWSDIRTGVGTDTSSTHVDDDFLIILAHDTTNTWQTLKRGLFGFDTSSIGTDVVDSATLSLYGTALKDQLGGGFKVYIDRNVPSDGTALANADYNIANWDAVKQSDTETAIASWNTAGYNDFPLNATGKGNINKSGDSWYGPRGSFDFDDAEPTWAFNERVYAVGYFADQTGTSNDPKLVVEYSDPPGELQNIAYTYDNVGNITTLTDTSDTGLGKAITFSYDDLYRLTIASTTAATSTPFSRTYTHSSIGNITNKSDQGDYTYSETGYTNPHAVTDINGTTYTYDNNGNVTGVGSDTYTWSYRDRLTASTVGSNTNFYTYDHSNMRIVLGDGVATTTYPSMYYNIKGATTTRHIFTPSGELIAIIEGSGTATTTNYIHTDHLGGTNIVTGDTGEVIETTDYYPYGEQRIKTGAFTEQRKYTGHEYDNDSNLTYAKARYYPQDVGRWLSQDPASRDNPRQFLADPQQLNYYSYVRNNPIILIDITGEKVYLAARSVRGTPGIHLYYYISPESSSMFSKIGPFTFGAGPSIPPAFGNLQSQIGAGGSNKDSEVSLSARHTEIKLRKGQTEDDLIRSLYRGHVSIGSSVDYRTFGNQPGRNNANSNNYAYTLAEYGGILNQYTSFVSQFSPVLAPGANSGVPGQSSATQSYGGGGSSSQASALVSVYNAFTPTNQAQAQALQSVYAAFGGGN